jgi:hypothetical protein
MAFRCLTSKVAQFDKLRTSRALCAPNRYDGANLTLQEPLPRSEWQSKQEFVKISYTCGSAMRLSVGADPGSIAGELLPLEHPASSITAEKETAKHIENRHWRQSLVLLDIRFCTATFSKIKSFDRKFARN